jgi:hypothetical protein
MRFYDSFRAAYNLVTRASLRTCDTVHANQQTITKLEKATK